MEKQSGISQRSVICITGQMRILGRWELYHFNIRGPLIVWCGIVGDHVIGPYFLEGRLTGQVYANFLQNVLPQLIEDVPLHVRMNMWMQHDGAPPHYAPTTPDEMKERIRRACTEITPQILAEVRRSFHQRINKCL